MELSHMAVEVHKNDQNFFLKLIKENGTYIGGFLLLTVVTLGVNGKIKVPEVVKAVK